MRKERAGVLVIRSGMIALIKRVREGRTYWAVPGGSVRSGETPRQAAQREAEQELGVGVKLGELKI